MLHQASNAAVVDSAVNFAGHGSATASHRNRAVIVRAIGVRVGRVCCSRAVHRDIITFGIGRNCGVREVIAFDGVVIGHILIAAHSNGAVNIIAAYRIPIIKSLVIRQQIMAGGIFAVESGGQVIIAVFAHTQGIAGRVHGVALGVGLDGGGSGIGPGRAADVFQAQVKLHDIVLGLAEGRGGARGGHGFADAVGQGLAGEIGREHGQAVAGQFGGLPGFLAVRGTGILVVGRRSAGGPEGIGGLVHELAAGVEDQLAAHQHAGLLVGAGCGVVVEFGGVPGPGIGGLVVAFAAEAAVVFGRGNGHQVFIDRVARWQAFNCISRGTVGAFLAGGDLVIVDGELMGVAALVIDFNLGLGGEGILGYRRVAGGVPEVKKRCQRAAGAGGLVAVAVVGQAHGEADVGGLLRGQIPAAQIDVRGRAAAHIGRFRAGARTEIGGAAAEGQGLVVFHFPALHDHAFRVDQLALFVKKEVARAGVILLVAAGLAHAEVAVAVNGQVGAGIGGLQRALGVVAQHGIGAHARADLGGTAGAAAAHVQIVVKIHALAFEADGADIGNIVAHHVHLVAVGEQA